MTTSQIGQLDRLIEKMIGGSKAAAVSDGPNKGRTSESAKSGFRVLPFKGSTYASQKGSREGGCGSLWEYVGRYP